MVVVVVAVAVAVAVAEVPEAILEVEVVVGAVLRLFIYSRTRAVSTSWEYHQQVPTSDVTAQLRAVKSSLLR